MRSIVVPYHLVLPEEEDHCVLGEREILVVVYVEVINPVVRPVHQLAQDSRIKYLQRIGARFEQRVERDWARLVRS